MPPPFSTCSGSAVANRAAAWETVSKTGVLWKT